MPAPASPTGVGWEWGWGKIWVALNPKPYFVFCESLAASLQPLYRIVSDLSASIKFFTGAEVSFFNHSALS